MTLHEAYAKAKAKREEDGCVYLWWCGDYGDFWGFYLAPIPHAPGIRPPGGLGPITINKITGETGFLSWPKDIDILKNAKLIPIDQFVERAAVA